MKSAIANKQLAYVMSLERYLRVGNGVLLTILEEKCQKYMLNMASHAKQLPHT